MAGARGFFENKADVLSQGSRRNCPISRMDTQLIQETAAKTLAGTISFPEVVGHLLRAGVEF